MALDPSIALAYRPPQVNVDVPSPIQQFGQVLTLRNMMQQGQLGQLGMQSKMLELQQQQLAYKQALGLANLFAPGADTTTTPVTSAAVTPAPAAPAAPGAFVLGQGQSGDAIHSPDGGASWVNSATGAPYSGTRYGETPVGIGTEGAPYSPAAPYSPVSAPAAPQAAAPVPQAAPAFPGGGIPGLPTWQKMIQAGGASAFPWIKNINEAYKSQLETEQKKLEIAQGQSKDMVRLSNGMIDNDSKNRLLPEAAAKGYITGDEARQFYAMDFNDPRFQARKESWGQQALEYDKSVELGFKRNAENRAQNEETRKWVQETDRQHTVQRQDLQEKVKAMDDPSQFATALDTPYLKSLYGGLVGKSLDDIRLWTGAGKPGETVPKPQSVLDSETAQAGARAGAETTGRIAAEDAPYVGLANRFQKGEVRWEQLSQKEQDAVGRILNPPGSGRTTRLSDTESTHLTNMQTGLDAVRDLRKELSGAKFLMTGPWSDVLQDLPVVGAKWDGLEGRFGMLQATVGDLIKGGVLRAADQNVYKEMFPKLEDSPWTVREKLTNLETKLTNDLGRYKESLRAQSRFIPGENPPAAPAGAAPAEAKPQYQTIEKTGAPGPKVTGTFTIGGGAAAAPPGKIIVQAPAGGGKYFLDSDKWPQYQKKGFTRGD